MSFSRLNVLARSFSSSSVNHQLIKNPDTLVYPEVRFHSSYYGGRKKRRLSTLPPIQVFGIEGRYATALYSAGSKEKSLEAIEKDLIKFQGLLKTDTKLVEFVKDPSIKRKEKSAALEAIGSKISLNKATTNLMCILAENGRLGKINQVINSYKIMMAANRGEVVCEVVTAKPLEADTKGKLESALRSFLTKGETLLLTTKVDPSILGGMIVSIGDKYVDMSVSSKVKKYSDIINQAA